MKVLKRSLVKKRKEEKEEEGKEDRRKDKKRNKKKRKPLCQKYPLYSGWHRTCTAIIEPPKISFYKKRKMNAIVPIAILLPLLFFVKVPFH